MRARHLATATAALVALALTGPGCDTNNDDDGTGGPATVCDFPYAVTNDAGKQLGEACSDGAECRYGVCLMPGEPGNIDNAQFGYCTRGCNCGNDEASQLSAEDKDHYTCLDPSGFSGKKRHVVLSCGTLADCTAVDAGWTSCEPPSSGGARRICQAQ